jgi:ABC-type branched-subunit amino acid transport system substrate-binding protein
MKPPPALAVLLTLAVLTAAGCGSRLDPDTVARVNGTSGGLAQGGVAAGGGSAAGGGTSGGSGGSASGGGSGTTSTSGGGGATTGGGGSTGTTQGSGENSATGTVKAGSCDGFKNQTGITDSTITIANVADISGPVPGIFESAQEATRAYAAYFNSTHDICGRELEVELLDSRADAGADQQAYTKACDEAFAAVGSMSAFDSGGAQAAEDCGLPDLRSTTVNPERRNCATCFAAQSVSPNLVPTAMPKYWLKREPEATQHVALFYINAGAAPVNAQSFKVAWEKVGWQVDLFKGIDVSEFNYSPYVQQMKDAGIEFVMYIGPYQNTEKLQSAMQQQGFEPKVYLQDATIYDERFVEESGETADGSFVYTTTQLYDDVAIKEMALYRSWLEQVKPGAVPNFYGLYAWSATRLFVEQAVALGGRLDRTSLVQALSKVRNWTGNGLHAPQQVGAKTTASCVKILQLDGGTWSQVSPGDFMCAPNVDTGVGD